MHSLSVLSFRSMARHGSQRKGTAVADVSSAGFAIIKGTTTLSPPPGAVGGSFGLFRYAARLGCDSTCKILSQLAVTRPSPVPFGLAATGRAGTRLE